MLYTYETNHFVPTRLSALAGKFDVMDSNVFDSNPPFPGGMPERRIDRREEERLRAGLRYRGPVGGQYSGGEASRRGRAAEVAS